MCHIVPITYRCHHTIQETRPCDFVKKKKRRPSQCELKTIPAESDPTRHCDECFRGFVKDKETWSKAPKDQKPKVTAKEDDGVEEHLAAIQAENKEAIGKGESSVASREGLSNEGMGAESGAVGEEAGSGG
jgi:hypothetical protein